MQYTLDSGEEKKRDLRAEICFEVQERQTKAYK